MCSETKQVIVVRSDLDMTNGKEDSQAAHAAGAFVFSQLREQLLKRDNGRWRFPFRCAWMLSLSKPMREWIKSSYAKIILEAHDEKELLDIKEKALRAKLTVHEIVDSGRTQFNGVPTLTCIAIGPDYPKNIDPVTGHLPLRK